MIQAKISPPGLPIVHVSRAALRAQLSDERYKVVLLSAPAGSGKTTLLADFVRQDLNGRAAWLTIDEADNDLLRLFSYMAGAIEGIEPGIGAAIRDHLESWRAADPAAFGEALVAHCESLSKPLTLVLDDLQNLDSPQPYRALNYLIAYLPPRLKLVLSTRADPMLRLSPTRGRGELLELRQTDLRFNRDEALELFRSRSPKVGIDAVQRLIKLTEGWIMGLQMIAVGSSADSNLEKFADSAVPSGAVGDYLTSEVLQTFPADIQDFLLMTSVLHTLDPTLCDHVTQRTDSARILGYLRHHNAFVISCDEARQTLRYHQLFAELLRLELRAKMPQSERDLNLRAAAWCQASGDLDQALSHLFAAREHGQALRLLTHKLATLYDAGLANSTSGWIERFPPDFIDGQRERMLDVAAILGANGRYAETAAWLERFESTIQSDQLEPPERSRLTTLRALLAYLEGDAPAAIVWAERALQAYWPKADEGLGCRLPIVLVRSHGWLGDTDAALSAASKSYPTPPLPPSLAKPLTAAALSQIEFVRGALNQAAALAEMAFPMPEEPHPPGLIEAHLTLAGLAWEHSRLESSGAIFERALKEAKSHHWVPFVVIASLGLARIWFATGRRDDAFELISASRHANLPRPLSEALVSRIDDTEADLLLLNHDVHEAGAILDRIAPSVERSFLEARVALAEEKREKARALLASIESEVRTPRQRLMFDLLRAHGGLASDTRALQRAIEFAHKERFIQCLVEHLPPFEHLKVDPRHRSFLDDVASAALSQAMPRSAPSISLQEPLSEGELRVLVRLPEWRSNREIASELYVSLNTVKTHLKSIYRKLDVTSRSEAVARARTVGLLGMTGSEGRDVIVSSAPATRVSP